MNMDKVHLNLVGKRAAYLSTIASMTISVSLNFSLYIITKTINFCSIYKQAGDGILNPCKRNPS